MIPPLYRPAAAPAIGFGAAIFKQGDFRLSSGNTPQKTEFCIDFVQFRALLASPSAPGISPSFPCQLHLLLAPIGPRSSLYALRIPLCVLGIPSPAIGGVRPGLATNDRRAYRNTPLHFLSLLIFVLSYLCSLRPLCALWLISYFVPIRPPAGGFVARISFASFASRRPVRRRALRFNPLLSFPADCRLPHGYTALRGTSLCG